MKKHLIPSNFYIFALCSNRVTFSQHCERIARYLRSS